MMLNISMSVDMRWRVFVLFSLSLEIESIKRASLRNDFGIILLRLRMTYLKIVKIRGIYRSLKVLDNGHEHMGLTWSESLVCAERSPH